MRILLAFLLALLPQVATATPPQVDPCDFFNAGCGPDNAVNTVLLTGIALFISVCAAAAVVFVIVGGIQMLTSYGDESKFGSGQKSAVYAALGYVIVLLSQAIVIYVLDWTVPLNATPDPIFTGLTVFTDVVVNLFNTVFVIVMLAAGYRMIYGRGTQEEFSKSRNMLAFAVTGAVMVNIARGIISSVQVILGPTIIP